MKKIASVMLLLGCVYANARQISPGEALTLASDFMNSTELQASSGSKALKPMRAPGVNAESQNSPYYVFNRGEADGFVIISGDDRAPKVLGYSDRGSFDADNLPPQLKAMMEKWAEQMTNLPMGASQHSSWTDAPATRAGEAVLMETAEWGQGYPYNGKCPMIDGELTPTGCTATAMAIVMKYHNWPETTQGMAYTNYNNRKQTVDFSSASIDWKALEGPKDSQEFKNAAADLNYMLGVAIDTYYSYESVADVWPVGHRMTLHFKYSPDCQFIERSKFNDGDWHALLREQLNSKNPVIYNGSGGIGSVGHAFVIDGYNEEGLYHVNWGWDGSCNGFYPIDGLIPDDRDFSQYAGMTINIIPDKSGKQYSRAFIPNADVYLDDLVRYNDFNFSVKEVKEGDKIKCMSPFMSYPYTDFEGIFGIAIVDEDNNIVEKLFEDDFQEGNNSHRLCGCSTDESCKNPGSRGDWWNLELPGLKSGQRYQIVCYDKKEPNPDWKIVTGGMFHPSYFGDKNLNSEICHVYVTVDKKSPIISSLNYRYVEIGVQDEVKEVEPGHFEVLKGGPFGFWTQSGGGDVVFDIKSYDTSHNEVEPIYVYVHDLGMYSMTLSTYEDVNEINIRWVPFEDNKHIGEKDPSTIFIENGLVYEVLEGEAKVIGYDNLTEETLIIPDFIKISENAIPVSMIGENALSNCEIIKYLDLGSNINNIEGYAFSLMPNLKSIKLSSAVKFDPNAWMWSADDLIVYLSTQSSLNSSYWLAHSYDWEKMELEWAHLSSYYSGLDCENSSYGFNNMFVPGRGESEEAYGVIQMWDYAINKISRKLMIKPLIDEVSIQKVTLNGKEIIFDEDFISDIPDSEDIEVVVRYVLHGRQEMTTVYSAEYNRELPDRSCLNILGDSNQDGIVNIADAVNVANYIVGLPTTEFTDESFDINKDGEITVSDVTSVIALIPSQTYKKSKQSNRSYAPAITNNYLVSSSSSIDESIVLSLSYEEEITALQFDICMPEGEEIPEIILSEDIVSTHSMQKYMMDGGKLRIMIYSISGNILPNFDTSSVVTIKGLSSVNGVQYENVYASDANGASMTLGIEEMVVGNGISSNAIGEFSICPLNGRLMVSNANGVSIAVYALDGTCLSMDIADTDKFEIRLASGIYLVRVGTHAYRVIIK